MDELDEKVMFISNTPVLQYSTGESVGGHPKKIATCHIKVIFEVLTYCIIRYLFSQTHKYCTVLIHSTRSTILIVSQLFGKGFELSV